jgi:hypothetical protein
MIALLSIVATVAGAGVAMILSYRFLSGLLPATLAGGGR